MHEEHSSLGAKFYGIDPATGQQLEPAFSSASSAQVDRAAQLAAEASPVFGSLPGAARAIFLRTIAAGIEADGAAIVDRAHQETGLLEVRLKGELARTANQLRAFAALLEEGSWVQARIDTADPDRKPLPKPDIRSISKPLGPVVVFGASNLPLAFSVAGGDTASAFAAGNPVIVKAHPAHPGTSELVGRVIQRSVHDCGLPQGTFSLLFDRGIDVGVQLVTHPLVKAVGFTGSVAGGTALMRLASSRPVPIPCYAEMGSTNPVFILPGAMRERLSAIATGLQASFTLNSGQFCTKPGLVFLPPIDESRQFSAEMQSGVEQMQPQTLLNPGIAGKYATAVAHRTQGETSRLLATSSKSESGTACQQPVSLFESDVSAYLGDPSLGEEVFGPTTLLLTYGSREQMLAAAEALEGHLTATIHGTEQDLAEHRDLVAVLESKVGRLIFNGFPTGVEVCHSMVHGGPFPATSDGRSTSVGTQAIFRFVRPFCYQNFPHSALPDELKDSNPLGIMRMVNGTLTRDAIG